MSVVWTSIDILIMSSSKSPGGSNNTNDAAIAGVIDYTCASPANINVGCF